MHLITKLAPNFIAPAINKQGKIVENFNFKEYISKKITILFFWPMDFTFVCPSEIIAFNKSYNEFKKRNVKIVGVSIDSIFTHQAWRNTSIQKGGIGKIKYFMVSDIKREIQKSYGIEHPELGIALRASFIIDENRIIRHQSINDLPYGRNINEIIRIIDAIKFHKKYKYVCPANWDDKKEGIIPTKKGISNYLSKNLKKI
ncbi:redoxin domain-containing protein [Buchnera aphidicola]|uniref:redoxin domain-containing protein n=1 Tax=Buchnera aphidicola TaxID=9 RepID=UPI0030EF590E